MSQDFPGEQLVAPLILFEGEQDMLIDKPDYQACFLRYHQRIPGLAVEHVSFLHRICFFKGTQLC